MKNIFISILFLAPFISVNAQTFGQVVPGQITGGGGNNAVISHLLGDIKSGNEKRNVKLSEIQGSAYTTEVFLPGRLFYKDEFQSSVMYRYNAYAEEIEIKDVDIPGAPVRGLARDKNIRLISPDGKSFKFETFIDKKGLTQNGYLTVLAEGKYTLYKRYDVKYTQGQKAQNSFIKAQPPRFSKFTEYYLELNGRNRIDELELSNRKLLKLVDANQKEALKQHLKEKKIKIKKERDILEVLPFLNN
jgi:hypothetical protein